MARTALKNVVRLINSVNKELPIEQQFLADLKRSIELQDMKNSRMPSQTYKPSSMQCIRNMYYQVTGHPQDATESNYTLVGICNSGSDIHQRIQQSVLDMKSNDIDCEYINVADYVRERNLEDLEIVKEPDFEHGEYETKLYHKKYNISFLCDGIIRYKGKYYILELKTENSNKFMMRQGVDHKHYHQGTAYSLMFGISDVVFVYISRDVLDMKSYLFTPTDDMKADLVGTITTCDSYVEQKKTPPRPENIDKRVCTYCAYRETCKMED